MGGSCEVHGFHDRILAIERGEPFLRFTERIELPMVRIFELDHPVASLFLLGSPPTSPIQRAIHRLSI